MYRVRVRKAEIVRNKKSFPEMKRTLTKTANYFSFRFVKKDSEAMHVIQFKHIYNLCFAIVYNLSK